MALGQAPLRFALGVIKTGANKIIRKRQRPLPTELTADKKN
jgi:hypothetical protein